MFTPESNMCYYQYRFHKKVKSLSSRSLCSPVKWQIFEQRGENVSGSLPIFGLDFLSPALMVYFPAFLAEDVKFNIKPSVKTPPFLTFCSKLQNYCVNVPKETKKAIFWGYYCDRITKCVSVFFSCFIDMKLFIRRKKCNSRDYR